jgi:hypothetical protein
MSNSEHPSLNVEGGREVGRLRNIEHPKLNVEGGWEAG